MPESKSPIPPHPQRGSLLARHLFGLVMLKIAVLALIYVLCFRPFARPDTHPAAIADRFAPNNSQNR